MADECGGIGFYNSSMSITALKANHGWIEKNDVKNKADGELKQVLVRFVKDSELKSEQGGKMKRITAHIPEVFAPLMMKKYRIKFCYGGRAGGKSYAFADSLLILGRKKKLLIACLREIQDSIKDSVHKLLCDRIAFYGLNDYKVYEDRIDNLITGTRFIFKGLREQDSQKIKSLEGVDIAWIEEAQTISRKKLGNFGTDDP